MYHLIVAISVELPIRSFKLPMFPNIEHAPSFLSASSCTSHSLEWSMFSGAYGDACMPNWPHLHRTPLPGIAITGLRHLAKHLLNVYAALYFPCFQTLNMPPGFLSASSCTSRSLERYRQLFSQKQL